MGLRVFSYGGGVQSTAALVLAAQGKIDYKIFLFCNVGDDSENPDTITFFNQYAKPYAEANGIEMHELKRLYKGQESTLRQEISSRTTSVIIPMKLGTGAPGNRTCTIDFKIKVVARWTKKHGASRKYPATVGLGISVDEFKRMRTDSGIPHELLEYPLINLRLSRSNCAAIIAQAGLPVPPKSSCFFCPFHSMGAWKDLQRLRPDLFQKSIEIESQMNDMRRALGKDDVYFTNKLIPLEQAVGQLQPSLFEDDTCESGYCMV